MDCDFFIDEESLVVNLELNEEKVSTPPQPYKNICLKKTDIIITTEDENVAINPAERRDETLECRKRKIHEFIEELSHELSEPKKFTPVSCETSCMCDSAIVKDLDQLINILQLKKCLVSDKLQAVKLRKTTLTMTHNTVDNIRKNNDNFSMNTFVSKVEDILTKDDGSYLQRAGDISRSLLDLSALNTLVYPEPSATPGVPMLGVTPPSDPYPPGFLDWSHNSSIDLTNTSLLLNTSLTGGETVTIDEGVYGTTPPSDEDELDLSDLLHPIPLYSGARLKALKKVKVLQFSLLQPPSLPHYVSLEHDDRCLRYDVTLCTDPNEPLSNRGPWVTLLGYIPLSSGRYYWEIDIHKSQSFSVGLAEEGVCVNTVLGHDKHSWALTSDPGSNYLNLIHNGKRSVVKQCRPRLFGLLFDADEGSLEVYNADDDRYICMVFPDPELLWFPAVSMNAPTMLRINYDVSAFHSFLM